MDERCAALHEDPGAHAKGGNTLDLGGAERNVAIGVQRNRGNHAARDGARSDCGGGAGRGENGRPAVVKHAVGKGGGGGVAAGDDAGVGAEEDTAAQGDSRAVYNVQLAAAEGATMEGSGIILPSADDCRPCMDADCR